MLNQNDNNKHRLLLEEFIGDNIDDVLQSDTSLDDDLKDFSPERYPYCIIFKFEWRNTFKPGNEMIPLRKILVRLQNAIVASHLFISDMRLESVKLKSDVNAKENPDPVVYKPNEIPDKFEGKKVLITDHYWFRRNDTVIILFRFFTSGIRKCSFEKFVGNIRKLDNSMKSVVQQKGNYRGGSVAFRKNLGTKGESIDEYIGRDITS